MHHIRLTKQQMNDLGLNDFTPSDTPAGLEISSINAKIDCMGRGEVMRKLNEAGASYPHTARTFELKQLLLDFTLAGEVETL